LYDPKQRLIGSAAATLAPLGPEFGSPHAVTNGIRRSREGDALIERHDNIGTQCLFDLHRCFWGDEMRRTVEMGLKTHAFIRHLAQLRQAEYLITAAVRQNRPGPAGERVEAA
jgi:hypothetical protein